MRLRYAVATAVIALTAACGGTSTPTPAEAAVKQEVVMGFVPSQTTRDRKSVV